MVSFCVYLHVYLRLVSIRIPCKSCSYHFVGHCGVFCAESFNTYKIKLYQTFFSCLVQILKTQMARFCNSGQLGLMYCVFSMNKNKSCSSCKCSCDCLDCFDVNLFLSFYFLSALQSDNNCNIVKLMGQKYILGPFQCLF